MRALIASPLGFLIGLSLGALGGGGSILAVPALVYVAGQSARDATTTSLMVVGMASLVGMDTHRRAGRVDVARGVVFGLVGIGGGLPRGGLDRPPGPPPLLLRLSGRGVVAPRRSRPASAASSPWGGASAATAFDWWRSPSR